MADPGYANRVAEMLRQLGIAATFGQESGLKPFREATHLVSVGLDIYGREQHLSPEAAAAWRRMRATAQRDGIELQIVSAFRSVDYQRQIIQRKREAGQTLDQILRVSAPPGFSEHHTGRAIDLTTPGIRPLTEEFESTDAFVWLVRRAKEFDFTLSYPRNNRHGIAYEPWHWRHEGDEDIEP